MRIAFAVGALISFLAVPYAIRGSVRMTASPGALGLIGGLTLIGVAASTLAVLGMVVAPEPLPMAAVGGAIEGCIVGITQLLSHPLAHWPSIVAAVVLVIFVTRLTVVATRTALDVRRGHLPRQALAGEEEAARKLLGSRTLSVRMLISDAPVAYTTGLFRPRAVVSSGLMAALDEPERLAVVAHELAHANRRHVAVLFMATVLGRAFGFIPGVRLGVEYVSLALETAADDAAVRAVGERATVARAIASSARVSAAARWHGLGAAGADVGHRVRRLTGTVPRRWPGRAVAVTLVAVAALTMLGVAWSSTATAITRERIALAQHQVCHLPHPPGAE
jgi:Zn-dependent protease with chaperone function